MKALVLFRSYYGNTGQVAEAIAGQLRGMGYETRLEQYRRWLYPGAAGIMHKAAKDRGLNVYEGVLRCELKGYQSPLADGELEKAASFAKEFASSLKKP